MRIAENHIPRIITSLQRARLIDEATASRASGQVRGACGVQDLARKLGVGREQVLKGVADAENMPFLSLVGVVPGADALAAFPENLARHHRCLPLFLNGAELTVAVGEPRWNEFDLIRRRAPELELIFVLADEADVQALIDLCYLSSAEAEVADYLRQAQGAAESPQRLRDVAEKAPVARMVEAILERANLVGASDVHLEPFADESQVRFRVDGLMQPAFVFPSVLHDAVALRLKILSQLNIVERQKPQDGRFTFTTAGGQVLEARVSFVRVVHGEKVVLRLLRRGPAAIRTVDQLGMSDAIKDRFVRLLAQPYGLMLVTGPTGSGKTSTLYAAVQHLNRPTRNVITLEDPVEAPLAGVNQIPTRPEVGLTFAAALKAVLRQDPDVVMVGEIRDLDTAEVALQGAMTGHMLLATLHTNSALEAITRLLHLGVNPSSLAPALVGVIAQRLVRRLCHCHGFEPAPRGLATAMGLAKMEGMLQLPAPGRCYDCGQTGYQGRLVLYEVVEVNDALRNLILGGATVERLKVAAHAAGMRSLAHAGLREVLSGRTSLDEVRRVIHLDF